MLHHFARRFLLLVDFLRARNSRLAEEKLHILINENVEHNGKYRGNIAHHDVAEDVHGLLVVGVGLCGFFLPVGKMGGGEPIQKGHD